MARKLNVAVIGAGWPGREHVKGYLELDHVNVSVLCDKDLKLATTWAEEFRIPEVATDYKKLLKRPDIDAISVCLPNFLHAPVTIDCLRAGKHVLCEKPPALCAAEAKRMAAAAKKARRTLMYAMVLRYSTEATTIRQFVDDGTLGQIYFGHAAYTRRNNIPVGAAGWFVDKKRSGGGALIDIGVHALDRCWYLMGCPKPVAVTGAAYSKFAHTLPKGVKFNVDDSAFAMVRFAGGATLLLEATWALHLPGGQITRVAGTAGGATWEPLTVYTNQGGTDVDIVPQVATWNPFHRQTAHFADCCRKKAKCISGAEQGVQLMQMLDAVYKSSSTGREVRIR